MHPPGSFLWSIKLASFVEFKNRTLETWNSRKILGRVTFKNLAEECKGYVGRLQKIA